MQLYDIKLNGGLLYSEIEAEDEAQALDIAQERHGAELQGVIEITTSNAAIVIEFDKPMHAHEYLTNKPLTCYLFVDFYEVRYLILDIEDAKNILKQADENGQFLSCWVDGQGDFIMRAGIFIRLEGGLDVHDSQLAAQE